MVKNHQHGAIGAAKHGSGGHLRDQSAKRARLEEGEAACIATLGAPAAARARSDDSSPWPASMLSREVVELADKREMSEEEFGALARGLSSAACRVATLDLGRVGFGPDCAKALADGLRANSTVRTLHIPRNGLGVSGGVALGDALARNSTTLTSLDMSLNDVGHEGGEALARGVRAHRALRELSLVQCGLGPRGGKALGEALELNGSVRRLDLTQNDLGVEGGVAVGRALQANTTLEWLSMDFNRIGFGLERAGAFAAALETNRTLTWLDMARNELGAVGGAAFARALAQNATLATLRLSRNELGAEGGAAVGAALADNAGLTCLDLSQNELGAEGVAAFRHALARNRTLTALDLAQNELGPDGAAHVAAGLQRARALRSVCLDRNALGAAGGEALARALRAGAGALTELSAAANALGTSGPALAAALHARPHLARLRLSENRLGDAGGQALCAAAAAHPTLAELDLSSNALSEVPVDCQLRLAGAVASARALRLDLSDNALTSPPLAHRADPGTLGDYLTMLAAEPHAVSRVRLMVVGFGGVGKTTFCGAATAPEGRLREYHASLAHCSAWDAPAVAAWALGLGDQRGEAWARKAAEALSSHAIAGADLPSLLAAGGEGELGPAAEGVRALLGGRGGGGGGAADVRPSARLTAMCAGAALDERECRQLALAVGSLLRKGYFSTVGAVKVEGHLTLPGGGAAAPAPGGSAAGGSAAAAAELSAPTARSGRRAPADSSTAPSDGPTAPSDGPTAAPADGPTAPADGPTAAPVDGPTARTCTLVDFAGQMEYLVSHQLLLASMHTLCLLIQPEASFADESSRHHGSWRYWLQFLRALGDRRTQSVVLASSQLDIVPAGAAAAAAEAAAHAEFAALRAELGAGLGDAPVRLDYRPDAIGATVRAVRARLSAAADAVSADWWVPASYERLAAVVDSLRARKAAERALPILSAPELIAAVEAGGDAALRRITADALLLQRALDYLEAVGDVMADARLGVLLLDPVGWFAKFLAHFIRDDGNPPAEVVRGVVQLADVVAALRDDYAAPEAQLPEVMSLVCALELCVERSRLEGDPAGGGSYLFPCLLPLATPRELARHWPRPAAAAPPLPIAALVLRGHRFRARPRFLPPGLFPTLVARLEQLPMYFVHSSRLWRDAAVLCCREASVLLRADLAAATLDVLVAAPADSCHFLGAAKGQASAARWFAHLIRQMLARAYPQMGWREAWLCPSPGCFGLPAEGSAPLPDDCADVGPDFGVHRGAEYGLRPARAAAGHSCASEGCWHFIGTGHKLEPLRLCADAEGDGGAESAPTPACEACGVEPYFPLRAGGGFGWASRRDAQLLRAGMSVAQPRPVGLRAHAEVVDADGDDDDTADGDEQGCCQEEVVRPTPHTAAIRGGDDER